MTGIGAGFAALGLAQRVKGVLPYIGCGLAVLMLCGALWLRGNHYQSQRDKARETVTAFKTAQEAATKWALAEKREKEASQKAAKDTADDKLTTARESGHDATADYARRNRCVRAEVDTSSRRSADLPGTPAAAEVPDRAGDDALVAVSPADLNICTDNSLRLKNAVDWIKSLGN